MCNDRAINYLSSIGFNAIQLPMEGIDTLLLMRMRESDCLEGLGSVLNLIKPSTPRLKPDIKTDCQVTDSHLEGLVTDSFGFNFGTDIINGILQQFGIKNDIIKDFGFSYQRVKKVKFSFDNILCDATTVGQLARYLRTGKAVAAPEFLEELRIDSQKSNQGDPLRTHMGEGLNHPSYPVHYVVVKTLKSNSFSVSAYDDQDVEVNLGIPIANAVSVGVNYKVSSKSENSVTFKGDKHLTFGVQIAPLWIEERGKMLIFKYGSPPNADSFTGELFDAPENKGIHPLFPEDEEVKKNGKDVKLVKLNQGNPIKKVIMSK